MSNPIKTSDLYQDTGELKALISELEEVNKRLESLRETERKNAVKLESTIKNLNVTKKEHQNQLEAQSKAAAEIARRTEKYNAALGENGKRIAQLKLEQQKLNQVNKLEAKLLTAKAGSYNELSAQYSLNKIRLNEMSKAEREGTKAGRELEEQTKQIYEEMKRLQEATGKHTLSVGDYAKAWEGLPGPIGQAIDGARGAGSAFKALLANPVVLFLTAISAALGVLFSAFKRSERGARLMEKASAILQASLSIATKAANLFVDAILKFTENPLQGIQKLGTAIKENLENRLKAIPDLFKNAGNAIKNLFTGKTDEAAESAKKMGSALIQAATGLDKNDQKTVSDGIKKIGEEAEKTTNRFLDLADAQHRVRQANRGLTRSIEDLTTIEEKNNAIADDTTKSFKEREQSARKAQKAAEQRAKKEIQLSKNNLSLLNTEIDIRRKNGEDVQNLLDQQIEAYREVAAAERGLTLVRLQNERTQNELIQDRLERDLDILIDGFDNQKTINERKLNDERLTFEERKKILQSTEALANESFNKQIATIQKFTGVQVDANELIKESDAVVLNQKIRSLGLSEIIEGRLLEIVRERKTVNQDLAETARELSQAEQKAALDKFNKIQELEKIEFEAVQRSEVEKTEFTIKQKRDLINKLQQLNNQYPDLIPIDTAKEVSELNALQQGLQQARARADLQAFEQYQQLKQSEFDLEKSTEAEKTKFRIEQEKARIRKTLELNKNLNDTQRQILKNQLAKLDQDLENIKPDDGGGLLGKLGINIDDEQKQAFQTAIQSAVQWINELSAARVEAANQAVEASEREVQAAENALNVEIQNRNAGFAHKVSTAQKELQQAKENQKQALKEQEKAQKEQQRLQTIQQASNLVSASAMIWSQLGFPLAIPAIAVMWGSFIASKVRAAQLAKKEFSEGGLEFIGGGSHASGNDTYLGFQSEGKPAFAERGEAHIIVPAKQTKKYKSILPGISDALRKGTFENQFNELSNPGPKSDILLMPGSSQNADLSTLEQGVNKISKQGERKIYTDGAGNVVELYKNRKRIYIKR